MTLASTLPTCDLYYPDKWQVSIVSRESGRLLWAGTAPKVSKTDYEIVSAQPKTLTLQANLRTQFAQFACFLAVVKT